MSVTKLLMGESGGETWKRYLVLGGLGESNQEGKVDEGRLWLHIRTFFFFFQFLKILF